MCMCICVYVREKECTLFFLYCHAISLYFQVNEQQKTKLMQTPAVREGGSQSLSLSLSLCVCMCVCVCVHVCVFASVHASFPPLQLFFIRCYNCNIAFISINYY